MTEILQRAFPGEYLSPVHRLDANTTGLVVFARSREAVRGLQRQFACGVATKAYRCRVLGHPDWNEVVSTQPISRKPAENGFRVIDSGGDEARTSFCVLTRCGNGETLVEAVPHTGRTNQIRVHLWDLGHPIVGDPVYLPQRQLGERQTISMTDPPMCLHASKLAFQRPHDGAVVRYEAPWPKWGQSSE
jgi:RluA family pseudouridine synthase